MNQLQMKVYSHAVYVLIKGSDTNKAHLEKWLQRHLENHFEFGAINGFFDRHENTRKQR